MSDNFDVLPVYPSCKNLSEIGADKRFIDFVKWESSLGEIEYEVPGGVERFTSNDLKCEKITKEMKISALENLLKNIDSAIESKIKRKTEELRYSLQREYEVEKVRDALIKIKQDSSEAS